MARGRWAPGAPYVCLLEMSWGRMSHGALGRPFQVYSYRKRQLTQSIEPGPEKAGVGSILSLATTSQSLQVIRNELVSNCQQKPGGAGLASDFGHASIWAMAFTSISTLEPAGGT
jgi:hypothetical protein